jgi:hypothetical protein
VTKTPVCVLGLGLIGGSVLRAAVAAGREALGYNRSAQGSQAAESDGFTATTDLSEALAWAASRDALIVLAVPMPAVEGLLPRVKQLADGCPLTDVIGVKGAVLGLVAAAGLLDRYVGGHPMAGSELDGVAGARADLFEGRTWVLTPTGETDDDAFARLRGIIVDFGAESINCGNFIAKHIIFRNSIIIDDFVPKSIGNNKFVAKSISDNNCFTKHIIFRDTVAKSINYGNTFIFIGTNIKPTKIGLRIILIVENNVFYVIECSIFLKYSLGYFFNV